MKKNIKPDDWTNLWNKGALTTFGEKGFQNNYDFEIFDFWRSQLSNNYQHIVDLACGNGALVWIANELLNNPAPISMITGVDMADINPFKTLKKNQAQYPMVKFIKNTSVERLPFDDSSIDVVISQYGVEYSDLRKTIPEIGRVLKPSSKMCFIVHSKSSAVLKQLTAEADFIRKVIHEARIHNKFLALDGLFHSEKKAVEVRASSDFKKIRTEINIALYEIRSAAEATSMDRSRIFNYLDALDNLFLDGTLNKIHKRKAEIFRLVNLLEEEKERRGVLINIALSDSDLKDLLSLIEKEGFSIAEQGVLKYRDLGGCGTFVVAKRGSIG